MTASLKNIKVARNQTILLQCRPQLIVRTTKILSFLFIICHSSKNVTHPQFLSTRRSAPLAHILYIGFPFSSSIGNLAAVDIVYHMAHKLSINFAASEEQNITASINLL